MRGQREPSLQRGWSWSRLRSSEGRDRGTLAHGDKLTVNREGSSWEFSVRSTVSPKTSP